MFRLDASRRVLLVGVLFFAAVGIALKLVVGLPVWAAIAIPSMVVGGIEVVAASARS